MNYTIVGTDHDLQKADSPERGLETKLREILRGRGVILIAEEVVTVGEVNTFGHALACELIGEDRWLSIDMTEYQRKDAGIHDQLTNRGGPGFDQEKKPYRVRRYFRHADGVRESFWLDRIEEKCQALGVIEGTVLITCGDDHVEFLRKKAVERGHTVKLDSSCHMTSMRSTGS